jgi:hypothetical protein
VSHTDGEKIDSTSIVSLTDGEKTVTTPSDTSPSDTPEKETARKNTPKRKQLKSKKLYPKFFSFRFKETKNMLKYSRITKNTGEKNTKSNFLPFHFFFLIEVFKIEPQAVSTPMNTGPHPYLAIYLRQCKVELDEN